jgi:hypothetical protein
MGTKGVFIGSLAPSAPGQRGTTAAGRVPILGTFAGERKGIRLGKLR